MVDKSARIYGKLWAYILKFRGGVDTSLVDMLIPFVRLSRADAIEEAIESIVQANNDGLVRCDYVKRVLMEVAAQERIAAIRFDPMTDRDGK